MNIHFTAYPNVEYRPHWTATLQRCNLVTSVVWSVTTRSVRVTVRAYPSLPDSWTSRVSRQYSGVYIRSDLPVFIVLRPCRFRTLGIRSEIRSAAFESDDPASAFSEALRSKVVSGGPQNLPSEFSRRLRQPCPAGLSRSAYSLWSHTEPSPAPVGHRGFGTLGISDAVGQFPLGRPAGKQIAISEKEGGAGYGG